MGMDIPECFQRILMRQAIIIHNPDIIISGFHGPLQPKVEAAGTTQIRSGIPVVHSGILDPLCPLRCSVGAGIVHYKHITEKILLVQDALNALFQQFLSIIGHYNCGDILFRTTAVYLIHNGSSIRWCIMDTKVQFTNHVHFRQKTTFHALHSISFDYS